AVHAWLGRLFENQGKAEEAAKEYEGALKLDSKNKMAQEALKRLKRG
ncbi:MAG: GlcNAc transferase, partial [Acidobacteria bacterium]